MKPKFEKNIAAQIPKTKVHEPSLPWKLDEDDLEGVESAKDKVALTEKSHPLKTRPIFLAILVVTIFVVTLYMALSASVENEEIKGDITIKEVQLSTFQSDLERVKSEKNLLERNSEQLEARVGDLSAQKQLFMAVIESLARENKATDEETNKE